METPHKKNKVLENDVDQLSALPDAVLHHILSFLDMKEVVQMSLLASRWRYLWISLPAINCNHLLWKQENQDTRFMNFVDRLLILRDGSDIKKLQLSCSHNSDPDRIGVWITSALRKHLTEMHLRFCPRIQIELPRLLFSSNITTLELNFESTDRVANRIKIPNSIFSMKKLTTLVLMFVELPDGNSSGVLVFNHPSLENLTLIECHEAHLEVLEISTPQLKTFVFLKKEGAIDETFRFMKFSVLVSAKIHVDIAQAASVVKLLENISCARTIDLSFGWFEEATYRLNKAATYPSNEESTSFYPNPRCLKLTAVDMNPSWINFMLKKFPCMETLVLNLEIESHDVRDLFAGKYDHLKCLEIGLLVGIEDDYQCLEMLLKNALVLEKLVIRMDKGAYSSDKETFGEKILSLFKATSRVTIFYYCS